MTVFHIMLQESNSISTSSISTSSISINYKEKGIMPVSPAIACRLQYF